MMARTLMCVAVAAVIGLIGLIGVSAPSAPATSSAPTRLQRLAAESLSHQARSLGHARDESTIARMGRIAVLLERARGYDSNDPSINRQLTDLFDRMGDLQAAAATAESCVRASPSDHAMALRWMNLAQSSMARADDRLALLNKVAADEGLDGGIRAAAAAGLALTHQRRGDSAEALTSCRRALAVDPHEPLALSVQSQLTGQTDAADKFALDLAVFSGNPRSTSDGRRVGMLLQQAGLYVEATGFFEHCLRIYQDQPPASAELESTLTEYFNAMLDAGRAKEAVDAFGPKMERHGRSLALRALMVEALRSLGREDDATVHVAAMAKVYEALSGPSARRSGADAAELAWFELRFQRRPQEARKWADEASKQAPGDPYVQRVLAAVALEGEAPAASGEEAVATLTALASKDPYAAAILARRYYVGGQDKLAARTIVNGAREVRTGPAWRELRSLAEEHHVALTPSDCVEAMRQSLAELPGYLMEMGRRPEKFVEVSVSVPATQVDPGEPVNVVVELRNVSEHPVPIGSWGLFIPTIFLDVSASGAATSSLPAVTSVCLPTPKYLPPSATVSQSVRLDVGPLEQLLMADPLADITLTVRGVLDPLRQGRNLTSSAPGVRIDPVTIVRSPLAGMVVDSADARRVMASLGRMLREGKPEEASQAARQTASLLILVRAASSGAAKRELPEGLTESALLELVAAGIRSPSAFVRAEMLAALHFAPLDERVIALLAPCIEDPSGLVRMRLIELLVAGRTTGFGPILDLYARDSDPQVRRMASVLRPDK